MTGWQHDDLQPRIAFQRKASRAILLSKHIRFLADDHLRIEARSEREHRPQIDVEIVIEQRVDRVHVEADVEAIRLSLQAHRKPHRRRALHAFFHQRIDERISRRIGNVHALERIDDRKRALRPATTASCTGH